MHSRLAFWIMNRMLVKLANKVSTTKKLTKNNQPHLPKTEVTHSNDLFKRNQLLRPSNKTRKRHSRKFNSSLRDEDSGEIKIKNHQIYHQSIIHKLKSNSLDLKLGPKYKNRCLSSPQSKRNWKWMIYVKLWVRGARWSMEIYWLSTRRSTISSMSKIFCARSTCSTWRRRLSCWLRKVSWSVVCKTTVVRMTMRVATSIITWIKWSKSLGGTCRSTLRCSSKSENSKPCSTKRKKPTKR